MIRRFSSLKPCPFCGGEATVRSVSSGVSHGVYTNVIQTGCEKCCVFFRAPSEFTVDGYEVNYSRNGVTTTAEKWNRRAGENA